MSAGMMPALDLPGLIRPGQFGPMMRVLLPFSMRVGPEDGRVVHRDALGDDDGTAGWPASIASMTASLANGGGTKTTVTSAPVFSIASATEPNTGTFGAVDVTVVPALRGFTPPTTLVPEAACGGCAWCPRSR